MLFAIYCFLSKRAKTKYIQEENGKESGATDSITTVESLQFNLATIEAATEGFSVNHKLGEGGFGVVYVVKDEFSLIVYFSFCEILLIEM